MEEQQKNVVEADSESSKKNIDPGAMVPLGYLWGTVRAAEREFASLLVAVFCAHISMLASQRSLNTTQSFQHEKSFPIPSYPLSLLPQPHT